MIVERGKITAATEQITINNVTINPMKEGDSYKYLGQDENLAYVGPVNKKGVINQYYKRVKKIWKTCSPQCICCTSINTYIGFT